MLDGIEDAIEDTPGQAGIVMMMRIVKVILLLRSQCNTDDQFMSKYGRGLLCTSY
jgi:hypothetical protein